MKLQTCSSYFSVAVIKFPDKRQLKEEWVYFSYGAKGIESIIMRKARHSNRNLADFIFTHTGSRGRAREQEVRQGCKSSCPTSNDILPLARLHFLKVVQPPQIPPATRDRGVNDMSLSI